MKWFNLALDQTLLQQNTGNKVSILGCTVVESHPIFQSCVSIFGFSIMEYMGESARGSTMCTQLWTAYDTCGHIIFGG